MADVQVLFASTLALTVLVTSEGGLTSGACAPDLAVAEACMDVYATGFEVDGTKAAGVATPGIFNLYGMI